jgi:hypothetical protein
VAVEKALAEAIRDARAAGVSWDELGQSLGVEEHAAGKSALIESLVDARRALLEHLLRRTD